MPDINGIPYVESTDLVSGWPTVSQSVAQEVSDQLASKLDLAGGKILQIVRATDSTARSTTSTSFTDVTGMSVTITPQKSDSALIIIACFNAVSSNTTTANNRSDFTITDASNNVISGAEKAFHGAITNPAQTIATALQLLGYATPATTSAVTFKLRFMSETAATTTTLSNATMTGQMYAIEVSA